MFLPEFFGWRVIRTREINFGSLLDAEWKHQLNRVVERAEVLARDPTRQVEVNCREERTRINDLVNVFGFHNGRRIAERDDDALQSPRVEGHPHELTERDLVREMFRNRVRKHALAQ